MGIANCCKKPTDVIVIDEIKNEGEKINSLDQDSYPQDTELVHKDDEAQQENSNQKINEEEGSPQIGDADEVPIKVLTPAEYRQEQVYENNENNNEPKMDYYFQVQQIQNQDLNNQIENNDINVNEIKNENQNENQNKNEKESEVAYQKPEPNTNEVEPINISYVPAGLESVTSHGSAAPIEQMKQVIKSQQMTTTPVTNIQVLNTNNPQSLSLIQENPKEEDLNKYFQNPPPLPTPLTKAQTTPAVNINMNEIEKLLQQQSGNIVQSTPLSGNEDLNKYFEQFNVSPQSNINQNNFVANPDINNVQQTTTTKTTTVQNVPIDLKQFGLDQINIPTSSEPNKQVTTITKTEQKIENVPIEEDYSKYFEQQGTTQTTSAPIDLKQFGLDPNNQEINNIIHGSNITFEDINSSQNMSNLKINQPIITTSVSKPIIAPSTTNKVITTSVNPTGLATSTVNSQPINLYNYGLNVPGQKTTTTTTITKTTGIPTGTSYTQSYSLPINFTTNKVTTTKVTNQVTGPTQTYGYSYTMPTTAAK